MGAGKTLKDSLRIAQKDLLEFSRSKMRLTTFVLMPIILIALFGFMFPGSGQINHIPLAVVDEANGGQAQAFAQSFQQVSQSSGVLSTTSFASVQQAKQAVISGQDYGVLIIYPTFPQQNSVVLIVDNTDPQVAAELEASVDQIMAGLIHSDPSPLFVESIAPWAPSSEFEYMAPGFVGLTVVMAGMAGLAAAVSRERELGTMDGLMVAPVSRSSIITGKAIAQTVRGLIQAAIIVLLVVAFFGVKIYGNPLLILAVLILGDLGFVGIGIIATSIASDQESATMILMMLQFPMIFLSGVLYPIMQLPWWLQDIARAIPLTYMVEALRRLMVLNAGVSAIVGPLVFMLVFAVVAMGLAVPIFNRAVTRR
ncbi:ABC transporter permease [Tardisphaera saccharovorans]